MSLKAFHIAFIVLSAVLSFGLAAYSILKIEGAMGIVWMLVSLGLGVLLIVYGSRFLKKMRQLSSN